MHLCSFLLLSIVIISFCLLSLVVWDLIEFPCPLGLCCIYRKVCEYWSANDWQSCSSVLEDTIQYNNAILFFEKQILYGAESCEPKCLGNIFYPEAKISLLPVAR